MGLFDIQLLLTRVSTILQSDPTVRIPSTALDAMGAQQPPD